MRDKVETIQVRLALKKLGLKTDAWKELIKKMRAMNTEYRIKDLGEQNILITTRKCNVLQIYITIYSFISDYMDEYFPLEKSILEKDKSCVLPIETEVESATYLFYSTRLAILQTIPACLDQIRQYFININLFYNPNYINYLYFDEQLKDMLELSTKEYTDILNSDIVNYIREQILQGKYISIHLDECYLHEKDCYHKNHFVHDSLIYGFEDQKNVFQCYGFTKNQKVKCFEVTYEELLYGYEKGKFFYFCGASYLEKNGYYPITLYSPKKDMEKYELFSYDIFKEKVNQFLNPGKSEMVQGDLHVYGCNVYQVILDEMLQKTKRGIVDFRIFQLLMEQKQCILKRMEYLLTIEKKENNLKSIIEEYRGVVKQFQKVRILYLKELCKEGYGNSLDKRIDNSRINQHLVEEIICGSQMEKECLKKLL